jgi:hypothetical protein
VPVLTLTTRKGEPGSSGRTLTTWRFTRKFRENSGEFWGTRADFGGFRAVPGRAVTPSSSGGRSGRGVPGGSGPGGPSLETPTARYTNRPGLDHSFRLMKATPGWTVPWPRNPEQQAGTWTWLVTAAYTQLRLTRPVAGGQRTGREGPLPPGRPTPNRCQAGFRAASSPTGHTSRTTKTLKTRPRQAQRIPFRAQNTLPGHQNHPTQGLNAS